MNNFDKAKFLITGMSGNSENTLAVNTLFIKFMDSLEGGVFLSQMIYFSDKSIRKDGFFWKSYKEWKDHTYLSNHKVNKYVEKLKEMGVLQTKLIKAQGSPTLHYKFDFEAFEPLFTSFFENSKMEIQKIENGNSKIEKTLTKTTTKTTTNNKEKQSAAKATNRNVKEYDVESDEYKLVELFVKQMQKVNELFKAPSNYNTWCKDMSLILDKDLIKISEDKNERRKIAQQIIIHSCNKTFYSKNIRSIPKLRGRLDEVWMDLKSDKGYNNFKTNHLEQPSKPINVWTPDQMFMQE